MAGVSDGCSEGTDVGVGEVFLLGHLGHDQVVLTSQNDQFGIFRIKLMVLTEFAGIGHAELRVVAAAPLAISWNIAAT